MLRDVIRQISDGNELAPGMPVSVVDERSELGACWRGTPQCDLGRRTDVMDGCPKVLGMTMMIRSMAPVAAVNYIRKAVGYDDYLKEYAQFRRMKSEELLDVADQLKESAAGFKEVDAWFEHMKEYKERLKEQAKAQKGQNEGVALMTMHSSKGLEFPIVFILDANEGITPHRKAVLDVDVEEERRMFYVAMTRAKERLHVCYVQERYGKKQERSRFILEYL